MKIRLLSDLHLEFGNYNLTFNQDADVVILAGDIGNPYDDSYIKLLRKCSLVHEHVIVIAGNHEYYTNKSIKEVEEQIHDLVDDNIHFLQMDTFTYQHVKFVGCTLWGKVTDKTLYKYINDYKYIPINEYIETHEKHKAWLINQINNIKENQKTVIITHHLPSTLLIHEEYKDSPLNCFYACDIINDISDINNVDVWCYGHTHHSNHQVINNTSFHCNPKGYPHEMIKYNPDYIFTL